jgi:Sec-independent protein secretion pathway component TatC
MSQTPSSEDELAGTEQPFVQHLMELRDRLVKAIVAVGVVAAVLFSFLALAPSTTCWPHLWWRICPKAQR